MNERILDGYVTAWHEFTWRDGAIEALKHLVDAVPLPLVIVTNQSCVGRGLVPVETAVEIQERMRVSLQAAGVPIAPGTVARTGRRMVACAASRCLECSKLVGATSALLWIARTLSATPTATSKQGKSPAARPGESTRRGGSVKHSMTSSSVNECERVAYNRRRTATKAAAT